MADPGFGKGGFMRMCTARPLLMHMRIAHAHIDAKKVAAAVLMASNCRETVSLFANYTSSKGVSMETVETPLDPPLFSNWILHRLVIRTMAHSFYGVRLGWRKP